MGRDAIKAMYPREPYGDYMNWLLSLSRAIAVWNDRVEAPALTRKQEAMLRKLKMEGLYRGPIPKTKTQYL